MTDKHRSIVRRSRFPASSSDPIATPLVTSVAYRSVDASALDAQYEGTTPGFTYAREGHPNATVLAEKIDWLEGAEGGMITSSGMSALSAIYLGLLKSGDHIVAGDQLYGRNLRLLRQELPRLGITTSFVDPTDAAAIAGAMQQNTRLVLIELVSNPTLRIADMAGIQAAVAQSDALLVVDNTFTTPAGFRPFAHGADIIMHSVTKLLAGHSDVTLGYVAARDPEIRQALNDAVVTWGLNGSPFDCWQAERGLQSFDLRFARAQSNAKALADALAEVEAVDQVLYPGRPDHPDHNRAASLLGEAPGNMVSFRLKGGRDQADRFIRAAAHIPFAPTLGDVATTLSHPASSSHRGLSAEERLALGITEGFFRVSVGIEEPAQIIDEITKSIEVSS